VSDDVVTDLMQRCRAFIFPATEDFGITAVEAQAAGAPVIAHASGGALETVIGARPAGDDEWESATGVFFKRRTPQSLCEAVEQFESMTFDTNVLRSNAFRFGPGSFERGMRAHIEKVLAGAS
jgi:glycosyltransferase involved in cell wall biosynthesis